MIRGGYLSPVIIVLAIELYPYLLPLRSLCVCRINFRLLINFTLVSKNVLSLDLMCSLTDTDIFWNISIRDNDQRRLQEQSVSEIFKFTGWLKCLLSFFVKHKSITRKCTKFHNNMNTTNTCDIPYLIQQIVFNISHWT